MTDLSAITRNIRMAVFDVDGVLTDGRLWLGADGTELKTMHVRDGLGFKRLQAAGITPAVISGRPSRAVEDRLLELDLQYIYLDSDDKLTTFHGLCDDLGMHPGETAVIGDDLPDLPLMRAAGLAMAVADAVPQVRETAHWISEHPGGSGAAREACELLVAAREGPP